MAYSSYHIFIQYYDQTQIDSDHKDLVISQFKAELYDLRQTQRDYDDLHTRLTNLEHRYNLLQEEKVFHPNLLTSLKAISP